MRPNEIISIPVGQLRESPFNPRRKKSEQGLQELADSIKAVGMIQPVTVRVVADGEGLPMADYQIVCGHRRFAAARMAGLTEVPCVIRIMTAGNQDSEDE